MALLPPELQKLSDRCAENGVKLLHGIIKKKYTKVVDKLAKMSISQLKDYIVDRQAQFVDEEKAKSKSEDLRDQLNVMVYRVKMKGLREKVGRSLYCVLSADNCCHSSSSRRFGIGRRTLRFLGPIAAPVNISFSSSTSTRLSVRVIFRAHFRLVSLHIVLSVLHRDGDLCRAFEWRSRSLPPIMLKKGPDGIPYIDDLMADILDRSEPYVQAAVREYVFLWNWTRAIIDRRHQRRDSQHEISRSQGFHGRQSQKEHRPILQEEGYLRSVVEAPQQLAAGVRRQHREVFQVAHEAPLGERCQRDTARTSP